MSFFQKARDRAQEAAAQFQQSVSSSTSSGAGGGGGGSSGHDGAGSRSSFTYTGSLPHVLRHGVASYDPRYEYNRSFHQLSGHIKSTRIDHEALARETKAMATGTYQWGQDQIAEKREDGAGDEALADVSDRLAYTLSLVGDLHVEHAKRLEESRADLKRIQKLESELAPRRQLRVKLHRELHQLLPERAMAHSDKIAPLEEQLKTLEQEDQEKEKELGKLKREALRSSYDAQFDSLIELGQKMALISRYGKLLLEQLPVYAPPFPTVRSTVRAANEPVWPNEARLAAIRAAIAPAVTALKPDLSLPTVPALNDASSLSRHDTIGFAESNVNDLAAAGSGQTHAVDNQVGLHGQQQPMRHSISAGNNSGPLSPLPEGGSLPPNLNLEPTVLPARRLSNDPNSPQPPLPPRRTDHDGSSTSYGSNSALDVPPPQDGHGSPHSAAIADAGPTFAETGSPVYADDPGPKSGVLSPRKSTPSVLKPMPTLPPGMAAGGSVTASEASPAVVIPSSSVSKSEEARQERAQQEQQEVQTLASQAMAGARLRRDGTVVRRGDPDWVQAEQEDLPPYHE